MVFDAFALFEEWWQSRSIDPQSLRGHILSLYFQQITGQQPDVCQENLRGSAV
jgi:hypothetical protein